MKTFVLSAAICSVLLFSGCRERILEADYYTPAAPQGLATSAGDQAVYLSWYPNTEPDLSGYNVYYSLSYSGTYHLIGTTSSTQFTDDQVRNGSTYYYAITAFNRHGDESNLTDEVAAVTPRPEGYDVFLADYRTNPSNSGLDFSSLTIGPYDDQYTDVFFEYYNGRMYFDVWDDSQIQDAGYTQTLYDVVQAPEGGWSSTHDAMVIAGHTYVIRTWDSHFAKVRVISASASGVTFDWTYQLQAGNPMLKGGARGKLARVEVGER
jgi:hypothetical protein